MATKQDTKKRERVCPTASEGGVVIAGNDKTCADHHQAEDMIRASSRLHCTPLS